MLYSMLQNNQVSGLWQAREDEDEVGVWILAGPRARHTQHLAD